MALISQPLESESEKRERERREEERKAAQRAEMQAAEDAFRRQQEQRRQAAAARKELHHLLRELGLGRFRIPESAPETCARVHPVPKPGDDALLFEWRLHAKEVQNLV